MSHPARAALAFAGIIVGLPIAVIVGVYINDFVMGLTGRHWWDPYIGLGFMIATLALLCWEWTR